MNCLALIRSTTKQKIEVRLQRACRTAGGIGPAPHCRSEAPSSLGSPKLLEERAETYGRLITAEMGKPLADSIFEIKKSAWDARHLAETGEAYLKPQPIPGIPAQIIYESVGPIFSVQPVERTLLAGAALLQLPQPSSAIPRSSSTPNRSKVAPRRWRPWCAMPVVPKDSMSTLQSRLRRCAAVIADPRVRAATVNCGSVTRP